MERREQDPGEKLRREAFERSAEHGGLVTRRLISERVRHPSERESREAIEFITSEVLNPILQDCTNVDMLKEFKEHASKKYGHPLSTPYLSAYVISDIATSLNNEAIQVFKDRELLSIPIEFIFLYDMSIETMNVALTIKGTEDAIRGTFDNELGNSIYDGLVGDASLSEQADLFLAEKARALECSKLLMEDPTGKSVVRQAVEEIENPKYEHGPCIREFAVYGARFAETAYGIVYPLAEKIIKPT